jgi:L-lactate utilization protein LutC
MNQETFLARLRPAGSTSVEKTLLDPSAPALTTLSAGELSDRLSRELDAVGGLVHRVGSVGDAGEAVIEILRGIGARRLVQTRSAFWEDLELNGALRAAGIDTTVCDLTGGLSREGLRAACFEADAGLTGVDYGVAETGTLVLLTRRGEGRAVSLVPPVHIGVLRAQDIVFELGELFQRAASGGLPSALTFVTGPSSTADIEQVHTVGVHGPRELHLVLVD